MKVAVVDPVVADIVADVAALGPTTRKDDVEEMH
jgi:hypothetical protein